MRKLLLLYVILFAYSCSNTIKLVDALDNEKIVFSKNKQEKFSIDGHGFLVVDAKVNDKKFNFIVDTGAGMFLFFDKSYIDTFNKNEKNYFPFPKIASIKTPDKKGFNKIKAFIIDSLKTNIFNAKNKVAMIMNNKFIKNYCQLNEEVVGIIGNDIFYSADNPIFFNFNDSLIGLANKELYKSGFKIIESKFMTGNKIKLKLFINNNEYWFVFDTGYSGTLHLRNAEFKNQKFTIKEINIFVDGKPKINKINIYDNVNIKLSDTINLKGQIESSDKIKFNLLGIKFIKSFDWIIDYKNKEVFFRPNNKFKSLNKILNSKLFKIKAKIIDNKLIISSKPVDNNKYNLGDIIIAINDTKITDDNICEMQGKLSKTNNWDSFNITIKGNIFN